MLMVIKRSGREEPFDAEKICNTIATASDDIGRPINQSDIKNLTEPILSAFKDRTSVTSREIFELLIRTMDELGFSELSAAYRQNNGNYQGL